MSTKRQIAHNTVIQFGGKILSTLLGLAAVMMLTRYLGTEQFGWYTTTISFLQFFGIMIDFGMTPVTAQMLGEGKITKKKLLPNIYTFRALTAFLFLGIAPLIALFFPYPIEVKIAIAFSTISFFAQAMNQVYLGVFQAELTMIKQAIGEVVSRIVLVAGLAGLMIFDASFLPIMGMIALAAVVYAAIQWWYARAVAPFSFAFDWSIWKTIMQKSWPITLSIVFNVLYLRGDVVLLSIYVPQTEVGLYGAAYRVIDILTQTAMMVMGLMLPLLAAAFAQKKRDFAELYQQSVTIMALVGFPLVAGGLLLSNQLMVFVASSSFASAGSILRVLCLAVIGTYIGAVYGHVAVALNKQKQTIWIYCLGAVLTIAGYIVFIPTYGLFGAAWMTVFSELLVGLLLFFQLRRTIATALPWGKLLRIVFATLIMGTAVIFMRDWFVLYPIVLGAIIYSLCIIGTKTISMETLRSLR